VRIGWQIDFLAGTAWLSRAWTDWREALVIVKPDTVIAWHPQRLPSLLEMEEPPPNGSANGAD
jgi:hypothetical protein